MEEEKPNNKIFVKRIVTKAVFVGIGVHLIYRFYHYTKLDEKFYKLIKKIKGEE